MGAALAVGPFLATRAYASTIGELPERSPCLFRALTGLPCPTCGATRALTLAGRADPTVWSYNWFWPAAFILMGCAAAAVYAATLAGRAPLTRIERALAKQAAAARLGVGTALLGAGWLVALHNRAAIVG